MGVAVTDDNEKSKSWKHQVASAAMEVVGDATVLTGPIRFTMCAVFLRPKGHFGTGRNSQIVKTSAPKYHTVKPDVLKLARCVEDALTGVVWKDDAQIVDESLVKVYGERECVRLTIHEIEA